MRNKILSRALPVLAILASVAVPTAAEAAIVSSWTYTVTSSLSNTQFEADAPGFTNATDTYIEWGQSADVRSSIGIANAPATGTVVTNGDAELANRYFHNNNILPLGTRSLESTSLEVTIDLTPTGASADDSVAPTPSRTFAVDFFETPNDPAGGICADGSAEAGNGCADIFVLDFDFGQFDFEYDGQDYSLFLFEDPTGPQQLGFLPATACQSVGVGASCFGFLTPENEVTQAQFVISVEATDVPEPATLGLLGLGLLALAGARRRKA